MSHRPLVLAASILAVLAFALVPTAESQRGGPCRGGTELLQAPPQPEVDARVAVCSSPPASRTARSQGVEVLTVKYRTGARGAFDTVFQVQYRPGGTPTARYEMVRADATGVRGRVTVDYPATGETRGGRHRAAAPDPRPDVPLRLRARHEGHAERRAVGESLSGRAPRESHRLSGRPAMRSLRRMLRHALSALGALLFVAVLPAAPAAAQVVSDSPYGQPQAPVSPQPGYGQPGVVVGAPAVPPTCPAGSAYSQTYGYPGCYEQVRVTRPRGVLLWPGIGGFVAGYVLTVAIGSFYVDDSRTDDAAFGVSFIPLIGPFILAGMVPENGDHIAAAVMGALQLAGVGLIVLAHLFPNERVMPRRVAFTGNGIRYSF